MSTISSQLPVPTTTYEEIMGISNIHQISMGNIVSSSGTISSSTTTTSTVMTVEKMAIQSLSVRLQTFRTWLTNEAHAELHPSICLVNGEATDGTKNAPVLVLDKSSSSSTSIINNNTMSTGSNSHPIPSTTNGSGHSNGGGNGNDGIISSTPSQQPSSSSHVKKISSIFEGRVGMIDHDITAVLYDRTMGCQVRTVREMKPKDTVMVLPKASMITPDLVASSDAGRALFACCSSSSSINNNNNNNSVWDALENTTICETKQLNKIIRHSGTQTLVKILQERKRAETAYKQRLLLLLPEQQQHQSISISNAEYGTVSTRAPYLLFLIHQRFYHTVHVPVSSSTYLDTMDTSAASHSNNVHNDNSNNTTGSNPTTTSTIHVPIGSPTTYAPYARTLPSSVSVPLCWKRNELAMLSGCYPGVTLLHDVGASTIHLVSEFIALLNAGILERFPNTFPPGLITWDRYVWAASVFSSRNLPATSYYNIGDTSGSTFQPNHIHEFQSPTEIWDELGVLIPLLDMFNHEVNDHQITWEQSRLLPTDSISDINENDGINNMNKVVSHPRAVIHKKLKKGSEIYSCYGASLSNTNLILQYGFAQINNVSDEVQMGWAISDAVGNVNPPFDCTLPYQSHLSYVYESNDERAINDWWTQARLALLEVEACCSDSVLLSNLKLKKKMTVTAYATGLFHPILLAAVVVATMPEMDLQQYVSSSSDGNDVKPKRTIIISKRHQQIIRRYLQFSLIRKLEKLLQNLNNGLSDFFSNLKLWTKSYNGGLNYQQKIGGDNGSSDHIGWQSFFDTHAYKTTMEVENRYYAMGTASCVLTLYDGQLRTLQASLDVVTDSDKFVNTVLKQLEHLGYEISIDGDDDMSHDGDVEICHDGIDEICHDGDDEIFHDRDVELCDGGDDVGVVDALNVDPDGDDTTKIDNDKTNTSNSDRKKSPRNRKRNRKRNSKNNRTNNNISTTDRPPALKLHVGNLSFTTTPTDLYDYFCSIYGQNYVLECHIPIERDTGKTRGFGFVAMPEEVAEGVLRSGRKFEIDGRVLKISRSSSAGAVNITKGSDVAPPEINNDRCSTCGYRPKYCICPRPNIGGAQWSPMSNARPPSSSSRHDPLINRDFGPNTHYRHDDYRRRDQHEEASRRREYDRDQRYRYHDTGGDDGYRRGFDRDAEYYRERSRRDRDFSPRDYHHGRDYSPPGSRNRSSGQRWEPDERDRSSRRRETDDGNESDNNDHGRKRSRSKDKGSRRKKGKRRHRSHSSGSSTSSSPP